MESIGNRVPSAHQASIVKVSTDEFATSGVVLAGLVPVKGNPLAPARQRSAGERVEHRWGLSPHIPRAIVWACGGG